MFDWVVNAPLFTTIFSFRKTSESKIKSSDEIKKCSDSKKIEAGLDDIYELKWAHFLSLEFLRDTIMPRKTKSTLVSHT